MGNQMRDGIFYIVGMAEGGGKFISAPNGETEPKSHTPRPHINREKEVWRYPGKLVKKVTEKDMVQG